MNTHISALRGGEAAKIARGLMTTGAIFAIAHFPAHAEVITQIRPVALSGQPVPGAPATTFTLFANGRIDLAGHSTFYGFSTNNGSGIFSEAGDQIINIARFGQPAPGTPAFFNSFNGIAHLLIDATGGVAFDAKLFGGDVCDCNGDGILENESGIWSTRSGHLNLIMREGEPSPELGVPFENAPGFRINSAGLIASTFFLSQPFPFFAVYREIAPDDFQLLALEGEQAAGLPHGVVYNAFQTFGFGDDGRVSMIGSVLGPDVTNCNDIVIWRSNVAGEFEVIAREGDPAPGAGPDTVFGSSVCPGEVFDNYAVSPNGRMAFIVNLKDPQGQVPTPEALYRVTDEGLVLLLRTDVPLPQLGGLEIEDLGGIPAAITGGTNSLRINNQSEIVFQATLSGPGITMANNQIIAMIDANDQLTILAQRGEQVPGAATGTVFGSDNLFAPPFAMVTLNEQSQIAFAARILPGGELSRTLILSDGFGELRSLATSGQPFDVSASADGSDVRVVNEIFFHPFFMDSPHSYMINDAGQTTFAVTFTDGSAGIFVGQHRLVGDATGDWQVNVSDLLAVINAWGACKSPCSADIAPAGPPMGDGEVNVLDLLMVINNWGP